MFRGRPQAERTSGTWKVSGTRGILVLQDHANVVPITHTLFKERRTVYFFYILNGISTSADKNLTKNRYHKILTVLSNGATEQYMKR